MSLTFQWHVSNSLTFPGFPDKCHPVLNVNLAQTSFCCNVLFFAAPDAIFLQFFYVFMPLVKKSHKQNCRSDKMTKRSELAEKMWKAGGETVPKHVNFLQVPRDINNLREVGLLQ